MKKLILLWAFFALPIFADIDEIGGIATSTLDLTGYSEIGGQAIASAGGGGTTEISETFEADEYDNAWTEAGTPDGNSTSPLKNGTYSLLIDDVTELIEITITDRDYYQLDFWVYEAAYEAATKTVAGIRTSGGGAVCLVRMNSSGNLSVYANGSDSTFTTDAVATSTWTQVRMIWNDAGTCSVEFSATGTFTGSGTNYQSKTGGTTTDATLLRINNSAGITASFDDILLTY